MSRTPMKREPMTLRPDILCDEPAPGVPLLTLTGNVESEDCGELKRALLCALDCRTHLVIDITSVPFLDSTALGLLVDACRRAKANGGELWIVGANAYVKRAFAITRLCLIFPMVDTAAEAKCLIRLRLFRADKEAARAAESEYVCLLERLHAAMARGDEAEAEDIRDSMDAPGMALSPSQVQRVKQVSARLYQGTT